MNSIENIKELDIFGQGIFLLLNKKQTAKTLVGGILTVVLFLGMLTTFIFMSLDIIQKRKPNTNLENLILYPRPNVTLDSHSFPISFIVQDEYGINIEETKYYKYHAFDIQLIITNDGTKSIINKLDIEYCTRNSFPLIDNETFYSNGIQNYFCVKDQNISISGFFDEPYIRYFVIGLGICKNSTGSNITCAPEQEIKQYLDNRTLYFNTFLQNTMINTQNFNNFINRFIVNKYKATNYGFSKFYEFFVRKQILISDNGFSMEFSQTNEVITLDNEEYDLSIMDKEGYLVTFYFYSSNNLHINRRTYLKIQYVLAQTGALAEVFIRLFGIISYIFSTTSMNKHILNKIYDFDLIKKESVEKSINNSKLIKSVTFHKLLKKNTENFDIEIENTPKVLENFNNDSTNKKLFVEKIENSVIKKEENLDIKDQTNILNIIRNGSEKNYLSFTYSDIIKMNLCCGLSDSLKEKKDLYEKSKVALDEYLDISFIIQKLEEFEKLKLLLLSIDQLAVFNFISKDFCSMNKNKLEESIINRYKELNKDEIKLSETILKFKKNILIQSEDITEVDKKLYDLLRSDLKN
jgi:hypothetical protein